jgi:hypothetical protein
MFANPLALLALSLLALPLLVHMLARLKARRVLFPTTKYLRATESRRLKLKRIDRWPLLAMRLSACGLLVLAVSDPAPLGQTGRPRAVLLLIDSSFSMNTEAAREQALGRAREVAASLGADDIAAVAQFDASIKLLCDFTGDRDLIESAIASYGPRYGAADFKAALAWADETLAGRGHSRELILISDLHAASVYSSELPQLSGLDFRIIRVEDGRRTNATPGAIATRAAGDYVEVQSTVLFSEGDRTTVTPVSFKIARRDDAAAVVSDSNAALSAKVSGGVIFGAVTANIADEFDADDTRFFAAPLPREEKVLLVRSRLASQDQAVFIEKAITASSGMRAERSDSLPDGADALARHPVVIAPIEAINGTGVNAAREYVSRGGSLILSVGAETDPSAAARMLNEVCATSTPLSLGAIAAPESLGLTPHALPAGDHASEAARPSGARDKSTFAPARFRAAYFIHAGEGEALMRYSNGEPAAVRVGVGAGRVLILGFGLSDKDSSLPHSPEYPTLIEWLVSCAASDHGAKELTVGQAPAPDLLRGLTRLTRLYSANGAAREAISDNQSAPGEPGVYEAEYQSRKSVFALNAPPAGAGQEQATESEVLDRVTIVRTSAEGARVARSEKGIQLWRVLAVAALVMSLIELGYKGSEVASDR